MKWFRLCLLGLFACSDGTTATVEQLNLDRPVDVAFACHGAMRVTNGGAPDPSQEIITSAQPIESCNIRSGPRGMDNQAPRPPGQEDLESQRVGSAFWYAFVLQSGPGTVAVARFETKPSLSFSGSDVSVIDSDPLTPGKNSISVGEDPIAIATDKIGCYEVIANAGSCDLSILDVDTAVRASSGEVVPYVERMPITNAAGEVIRARPAAIAMEPPGGVIGAKCPDRPTGLMYVAFPSCHLVAGVDVSTGQIVTGIQFDENGVPTVVDGNVSCPAECDGEPITPGVRPVALDLEYDTRIGTALLAIGAENSNVVTAYALDNQTFHPLSLISVPLEDTTGTLGVTSVSITPVIGMGGAEGDVLDELTPGGEHQFIYAVATDGSVRVVDVTGAPRECDTQVDPRFVQDIRDVDFLSCMGVGSPSTPPRRAGARGPGIELIGDAIPTSVDVTRVDKIDNDSRPAGYPTKLIGYFGLITASNGRVYVFNVDNDDFADFVASDSDAAAIGTPVPLVLPHQLRDAVPFRGLLAEETEGMVSRFVCDHPGPDPDAQTGNQGGPRIAGSLQRSLPAGVIAPEKTGGLPSIRQVFCDDERADPDNGTRDRPVNELSFSAPPDVRRAVFPDLRALRLDETWSLTWEGSLSNDRVDTAIDGPPVRMSQVFVDASGMRIVDATRPFCDAGVEPYDIVQMRGCDPSLGDAGCPAGYTCYVHPQSQVVGLGACMLIDEAERLANACKAYLTSLRRYTVRQAKSGELQLLPRKHVLRTTPIDGCESDNECKMLADYAAQNASSALPGAPNQITDSRTWRCHADPDRRPMPPGSTGKRCIMTCNADTDCIAGTVCQPNPNAAPEMGYCMEGVVPPQACVNAPQRYELRAGEAFALLGSRQGFIHSIVADAGDVCVRDPNANPYQVSRIPLDPPDCDPSADPLTGQLPDGSFEPNPCKLTVDETEYKLNYLPGTCTLDPARNELLVTREATGLRLRHQAMHLTIVDPTYPGDLMCHGDRMGNLENVPLVMPGFTISFRQTGGFTPLALAGIAPALPTKVLRGPTQSMWIVDEGDFLSSSSTQASTRGKVYRVEMRAINIINQLE